MGYHYSFQHILVVSCRSYGQATKKLNKCPNKASACARPAGGRPRSSVPCCLACMVPPAQTHGHGQESHLDRRERAEKTRAGAYVRMAETQQMDSGAYTSESSGWPAIACACVPLSGLVDLVCCGCSRSISTTRFFLGGGCRPIATFPFPFAVAFDLILFSAACHAYRARFIFIRLTASGQEI
jgi:hypothetical protein